MFLCTLVIRYLEIGRLSYLEVRHAIVVHTNMCYSIVYISFVREYVMFADSGMLLGRIEAACLD